MRRPKVQRHCEVCNQLFTPKKGPDYECVPCKEDTSLDEPNNKCYKCSQCGIATTNRIKCKSCWGGEIGESDASIYF